MTTTKYFSGETELVDVYPMRREAVRAKFPTGTIKRQDSFSLLVGGTARFQKDFMPVTRIICVKLDGKNHKCDARCRSAKGSSCECECQGKFHGAGN